jgi:PKD repeat protein
MTIMNVLRNIAGAALIIGSMVSCEEEDFKNVAESTNGPGLTEITFSSFTATVGPDADGLEDGTYVTVEPLAIGVSSYTVDFGAGEEAVTIGAGGSASYDYPNDVVEATYTITVTANSDKGLESVLKTQSVTLTHSVSSLSSVASSPTVLSENVSAIFSDGNEAGGYNVLSNSIAFNGGNAQYNVVEVGDPKNKVIQYSRLQNTITASITFDPAIAIADVFGTGASADYFHIDLHSIHQIGVDKVKLTMGGQTLDLDLDNNVWTGVDVTLASAGITQIEDITLELATDGSASNEATLNVDNIYLYRAPLSVPEFTFDDVASDYDVTFENASERATSYSWDFGDGNSSSEENPVHSYANDGLETTYMVTLTTTNTLDKTTSVSKEVVVGGPSGPINPEIADGDFNGDSSIYGSWKIANTTGNSNPFSGSSDGSCKEYDGTETGTKTRAAKWSSSNSADDIDGTADAGDTRYTYQAVTLSPNTDYIFEYEYAIKTGGAETNAVVAAILNGHYSDSDVALASNPLVEHIGTIAEGKFADNSCGNGTTVSIPFRSNSVGEVSIFIYAFSDVDAFVDNVKIYPAGN